MSPSFEAVQHIEALRRQLAALRSAAGEARVWARVDAGAGSFGLEAAFEGLRGADGLAVETLSVACAIRDLGWRGPVLLLHGAQAARELEGCSRWSLWHVIHDEAQIDWLAMHKTHQAHCVFLRLREGPGSPGFAPEACGGAWVRLAALPQVDEISLWLPSVPAMRVAAQRATRDLPGDRCCAVAALRRPGAADITFDITPYLAPDLTPDWILAGDGRGSEDPATQAG